MQFTLNINWPCFKCQQFFTNQDLMSNNYQVIILPELAFQHQVCPIQSYPEKKINLNLNIE